ncbi:MAG: NADH-quinone oxidoreductase subunit J [Leptolyngbyaceae bacterium]|nr:NADH-quinone oxidoreductase subunit J [Leptolyngbyaceae bacterium]
MNGLEVQLPGLDFGAMSLAEGVQFISFVLLGLMMVGAALGVVLLANIVYSAFLLGVVFVSLSGLFILLTAGFVAAAQILIYVGAVNVLILFGIMLVNKREGFSELGNAWLGRVVTGSVCTGLFALLGTMILSTPWSLSDEVAAGEEATIMIGKHLFSDFLLPFEVASVLLLIALLGAIVIARRELVPDEDVAIAPPLTLPERPRSLAQSSPQDS